MPSNEEEASHVVDCRPSGRGIAKEAPLPMWWSVRLRACGLTVMDGYGDRRGGGGGVAGGGTLVDGGGYLRNCVGGARTVCAATSPNLYGFSSGLMGSDDAGSPSSPRATRARVCEL